MYKDILFGEDARNKIVKGVNIVADAVASTLGPRGQNVIFEDSSFPTITKDGVTVAKEVFLEDKFENMGVMTARDAAEDTNREAGDGTTGTIVLLREIVNQGHKAIASGMNPILLKRGMDDALQQVLANLDKQVKEIKTDDEKRQIATISANNDEKTGKLIADVIKRVGTDGVVTVTTSNSLKTEVEYVQGTKLNSGFLSHIFINDPKRLTINLENADILICTDVINLQSQLVPVVQSMLENGRKNFVLFADKIEGQALAFIVQNALQGKFNCVPVTLPSFGNYQRDLIYDLATLTTANVLGENDVRKIEDATIEDAGFAKKVIIGRNETILSGTSGDVKHRIQEAKTLLKEEKDTFNIEKLKERIGRLKGSVANIQVGGASTAEQNELRYRIEDALNSTKAAIEEGIVEGGGMALLKCSDIKFDTSDGEEYNMGKQIVLRALSAPLKKIAENGGQSGETVVGRVIDRNLGFNALTGEYEDLFKAGIIDPKKVIKNEIINAVATASTLLTSNVAIAHKPKKDE